MAWVRDWPRTAPAWRMRFAIGRWVGFTRIPPRLDLFKAVAAGLASQKETLSLLVNSGPTWARGSLERSQFRAKFSVFRDYQRLHEGHPTPTRDCFNKLGAVLREHNSSHTKSTIWTKTAVYYVCMIKRKLPCVISAAYQ